MVVIRRSGQGSEKFTVKVVEPPQPRPLLREGLWYRHDGVMPIPDKLKFRIRKMLKTGYLPDKSLENVPWEQVIIRVLDTILPPEMMERGFDTVNRLLEVQKNPYLPRFHFSVAPWMREADPKLILLERFETLAKIVDPNGLTPVAPTNPEKLRRAPSPLG